MGNIMDTQTNGTSGLGLPSPSADQTGAGTQRPVMHPPAPTMTSSDKASEDLDQEWVYKAKAIVEKTKGDPYTESIELSKIKADYLKTRYNKYIKTSED